ncbi:XRE family transcriptional regulator [Streptomyces sp. NBC_01571]|uniref:XRE family transcriptional regulator n=1 Tax=Streptomyces sp. NBC_01571 TaxID=2975883 RepID=UPI002258F272|nr:XRE family transcriptional regulator [Streptomyces sp. NBC_01571]MCX4577008.1 XRE family transcriptional regulator [Streptomyces sp. NBC_01571]
MPRWKALPDELDPQVREFAGQLRRLVDRSGLSVAALADRTGYSRTSWERYLNGRLLAPKGAIVALAEVTGSSPVHLTTMWELAERAWSRSEMRHDMTMEAIRISQARAALGESGASPANGGDGQQARKGRSATVTPGVAGPAGVAPSVPPQPTAADVEDSVSGASSPNAGGVRGGSPSGGSSSGGASRGAGGGGWGAVATPSSGSPGRFGPPVAAGPAGPAASADGPPAGGRPAAGKPHDGASPGGAGADGARRKRRLTMFLAGVVGALVVIAVAVLLTGGGGDKKEQSTPGTPTTSAAVHPDLPAGVKCSGSDCTGKDPENMGCGGQLATTPTSITVGTTLVEVRYSKTCAAAWARITQAVAGDSVVVSAAGVPQQTGSVDTDTDAYTPMVAVKGAGEAKACVTLKSGQRGCTR